MRSVLKLIKNDLKQFFADRGALILCFLVPPIVGIIFGVTFGGMGKEEANRKIDMDYVDLDQSEISGKITTALNKNEMIIPHIVTEEDAYAHVKGGKRAVALIIPKGFGEKVKKGEEVDLKIINDPSNQFESMIMQSILPGVIFDADLGEYMLPSMVEKMMKKEGASDESISVAQFWVHKYMGGMLNGNESGEQAQGSSSANMMEGLPIGFENEQVVGTDVGTTAAYVQSVISSMLMFLMFGISFGAAALIQEKKKGTLKRLLISPLSVGGILTGKLIVLTIIGLMQVYFMLIMGWLVFGLQIWDFPGQLFMMALASALMASGIGIFLSGIARTEEQVSMLAPLVIIILSAVGGAMIPRMFMPHFMRQLGYLSPVSWAVDGFHNVFWRHQGMGGMITEFSVLLAFALVFLIVGTMLVRIRMKSW